MHTLSCDGAGGLNGQVWLLSKQGPSRSCALQMIHARPCCYATCPANDPFQALLLCPLVCHRVMVPKASMVRLAVKAGTQAKRVM
jgi:hypothetical protein